MIQTVYLNDFRDAFQRMDRGNQFSYEGLELIYDHLEEWYPDMELDVIAICCDFSQCSLREFKDSFPAIEGIMIDEGLTLEDSIQYYIEENGYWFAFVEGGQEIVFQNF